MVCTAALNVLQPLFSLSSTLSNNGPVNPRRHARSLHRNRAGHRPSQFLGWQASQTPAGDKCGARVWTRYRWALFSKFLKSSSCNVTSYEKLQHLKTCRVHGVDVDKLLCNWSFSFFFFCGELFQLWILDLSECHKSNTSVAVIMSISPCICQLPVTSGSCFCRTSLVPDGTVWRWGGWRSHTECLHRLSEMEQDGWHGEGPGDAGGRSYYQGETVRVLCHKHVQCRKLSSCGCATGLGFHCCKHSVRFWLFINCTNLLPLFYCWPIYAQNRPFVCLCCLFLGSSWQ